LDPFQENIAQVETEFESINTKDNAQKDKCNKAVGGVLIYQIIHL
jgi:hypothetical protein